MRWTGAAPLLAALVIAQPAFAHDPPAATGLWWVPSDSGATAGNQQDQRLIVRTTRGLLVEEATGPAFRFLCNEALGIGATEEAPLTFADPAHPLVATYERGLQAGTADLCQWKPVGKSLAPAFDLAVGAPTTYFALAGDSTAKNHFFASRDGGSTWSALADGDVIYTKVRVAPSDPHRVYLTGVSLGPDGKTVHHLAISDDGGVTLTARPIALERTDLQAMILGVSPADRDRIYVRVESTSSELRERLLVSRDAGRTFEPVASLRDIHGLTISTDGATVWVGGREGLLRSDDGGLSFSRPPGPGLTRVGCLAVHGAKLYACGAFDNRLGVGVSDDGGGTFKPILSFAEVSTVVPCPGDPAPAPTAVCADALAHWGSEVSQSGTDVASSDRPPDAGAAASGAETQEPVQRAASGCGIGGPARDGWALVLALAALMLGPGRRGAPRS